MVEVVEVEPIHEGWGRFSIARLRLESGATIRREIEDHGSAAVVLPYDPERRCAILVEQFRAPVFLSYGWRSVLEAVAGRLEAGEDPSDCARREAMEEAGLRLGALEPVVLAAAMPGISTELLHLFLAPYGADDRVGQGGGLEAESEEITVHEVPLSELARRVDADEVPDLKTLFLVQTLRLRRPELWA